jgi:hypothetical protein
VMSFQSNVLQVPGYPVTKVRSRERVTRCPITTSLLWRSTKKLTSLREEVTKRIAISIKMDTYKPS